MRRHKSKPGNSIVFALLAATVGPCLFSAASAETGGFAPIVGRRYHPEPLPSFRASPAILIPSIGVTSWAVAEHSNIASLSKKPDLSVKEMAYLMNTRRKSVAMCIAQTLYAVVSLFPAADENEDAGLWYTNCGINLVGAALWLSAYSQAGRVLETHGIGK